VLSGLGQAREGADAMGEAEALARRAGNGLLEAEALAEQVIAEPGAPGARPRAERALDLVLVYRRPDVLGRAWWAMALATPDPAEAIEHLDRGIAAFGDAEPQSVGRLWCLRGERALALGRREDAAAALERARALPSAPALAAHVSRLDLLLAAAR